jgi:hypothetical protein
MGERTSGRLGGGRAQRYRRGRGGADGRQWVAEALPVIGSVQLGEQSELQVGQAERDGQHSQRNEHHAPHEKEVPCGALVEPIGAAAHRRFLPGRVGADDDPFRRRAR